MTKSQTERLALLLEELGEVQHAIGKVLRHGYDSYNPYSAEPSNNKNDLEHEIGDVLFAIELLCAEGDISERNIEAACDSKAKRVWQYLHEQSSTRYFRRWPSKRP